MTVEIVAPAGEAVQQSVPYDMQSTLNNNLERALGKLAKLEMPVTRAAGKKGTPPTEESTPPDQTPQEKAPAENGDQKKQPTPKETPPAKQEASAHVEESTTEVAPATAAPTPPTPPPAPMWGPQQTKALQEVLDHNKGLESRLAQLQEEVTRYQTLVQNGDVMGFAEQAKLTQKDLLDTLNNGGKQPVTRPYVRQLETHVQTLESKLNALEQALTQRDTAARNDRELSEIQSVLKSAPEYGILTRIPDAPSRIQALIREREAAARDRGEATQAFTPQQAAALLKETLVSSLKQLVSDDAVKRELGLIGETATPDTVQKKPAKGITGRMASGGSLKTTQGYDPDAQLRRALAKMIEA